jgi:hypothetical protein
VAIAKKLTTHRAFESFVPMEKAGVVNAPHRFHFVYALFRCKGGMTAVVGEICSMALGSCEKVSIFSGVVAEKDGGG